MQKIVEASFVPDALVEEMHVQLMQFCNRLIDRARIVPPDNSNPASDRCTLAELSEGDLSEAVSLYDRFTEWVATRLESDRDYLSASDTNMFRATTSEIRSYVLMKRRGTDVSAEMYREFYTLELASLLAQQERVLATVRQRHKLRNMAQRRRCWRDVPLTLGVEEEYQIVSSESWELVPEVDKILADSAIADLSLGREVFQSQLEFKTRIHDTVAGLASELRAARLAIKSALPSDLAIVSAATHPFSTWNVQRANETARTEMFMHDMQDVVRRLVTCGLHVHIGIEDRELAIQVMNASRAFLPLLLAISASSPFWKGRLTGLMSYRSTVFAVLPRTGIPPTFNDYREFGEYLSLLGRTKSFDSAGTYDPTKIWWDVRLHPKYDTIEFRVCDACSQAQDAICIAAVCQALVAKLSRLLRDGVQLRAQPKHLIEENKWRAARYGSRARFIDPFEQAEVTASFLGLQLLDFVQDVLSDLGSEREVRHLLDIIDNGTSAKRQIDTFRKTGDIRRVVQALADEFVAEDE